MLDKIKVRSAVREDREPVCALVQTILEEFSLRWDPTGIDADLLALPDNYRAAGGAFDVIVNGRNEVLGTVGLWPLGANAVELRKMYFASTLRGYGVGKAVLNRALLLARAQGFEFMELETARVLTSAIGLYRSFGFQILDQEAHEQRCDYRMSRRLDDYEARKDLLFLEEA